VFIPATARLAVTADWKVSCPIKESAGAPIAEEGHALQFTASEQQAEIPLRWLQSYLEGQTQFIKMGQHESHATVVDVGAPQGSMLSPLLFAVYYSPIADVIAHHGVQYHQYADDVQLHLTTRADNTPAGLSVLAMMSDSGIYRTVYSSIRTSQKL